VSKKNILFYIILLGLISSIIPYILGLGGDNVFIKDFYAKRIMVLVTIPLIFLMLISTKIKLNLKITFYLFFTIFYLVFSLVLKNPINYLVTDLYIILLPIVFLLLLKEIPNSHKNDFFFNKLYITSLVLSMIIVSLGIKLQYSYLSLIGIIYILFYAKITTYKSYFLLLLLPIIIYESLIGKNAVIMLLMLLLLSLFFEKKLISKSRKYFIIMLIISISLTIGTLLHDVIIQNDAYKHFIYFLRHANFYTLEFNDNSTGNRIFEAIEVLNTFNTNNIINKFFGNGLGAVIDLSKTIDSTVLKANIDATKIHHIHMGIFTVLHRYGLFGITIYLVFIIKTFKLSLFFIKKSNKLYIKLSALYLIIILFDSLISFPHMVSNYFFWFSFALIIREKNILKRKTYANPN